MLLRKTSNKTFISLNISSSLNMGLLDLNELINKIVDFDAPYNAKEGFYTTNNWLARVYASSLRR